MKAEHPSPAAPVQPGPHPAAVDPTLEHHGPLPPKDDPSPVLVWLQTAWDKVKAGRVGNPKWLALIVGLVAIGVAWWFFAYASKKNDSSRWVAYDQAVTQEGLKTLIEDKTFADTAAARVAKLNLNRGKLIEGLGGLTAPKLSDRQKAAGTLEEVRDELTKLADEFKSDKTLRATCYLVAADAETALVGVPKVGVLSVGLEVKQNGRGQVDKVVELKKKAAEAIGANTEAGQKLTAEADKLAKTADEVYKVGELLNRSFNVADPVEQPTTPPITTPPAGTDGPKAPAPLPDPVNPIKPEEKKPEEKKPEEKKPDDGPKPPAPLPPEKK